ncbi:hypothetical protein SLEP1_g21198 [Rubroshorea leprosula]|uniref:SAC domain-containing protein n=2 Tax=Rubroshorea leprosula TaxID=152421 RepID=A0AAV5JEE3_9ROSI|nr:hypothetical protein SLEP1_g21198 [Rubroshorea leprosula]
MAEENWIAGGPDPNASYLQKFGLYETSSYFYMIGRDKDRTMWRVLKIDRLEPSELNIVEDCTTYSETEYRDILRRIHEGNRPTGGLKFVTVCYGIIGFIKFLGPYYMLLITKRRKLGLICGHTIYAISKSKMISIPHASVLPKVANSKDEKRYKKLLCMVDLTKDFFFSYSYNVMHSLQKNLCNSGTGQVQYQYETMFVWNEYLTRGIRDNLKNNLWTVALVYGFFKQVKLSVSGRDVNLTLIARRSRHYAGTRYLKRGVNDKGRVANDVETEQIVSENVPEGSPMQISSVVQIRGSIPLFWSQETSRLNLKPNILLSKKDTNYEATRLHFVNLAKRYGNPIIILNLIRTHEKKPRESILCAEFANAVRFINKSSTKESRLRFLHLDLHKHSRNKAANVLAHLSRVAAYPLNLTGFFHCQVRPNFRQEGLLNISFSEQNVCDCSILSDNADSIKVGKDVSKEISYSTENDCIKPLMFQKGVLRTNCIDCLDRTNVAQFAYGFVALGRQLHALGFTTSSDIELDNPLAEDLTRIYETMGDTLAIQYGGSAAHNKIFSQWRGQWKAATQSQEFFRTLQRYYSNAYMDAEKQNAINVFLGHFQPQQGKPALWELDSDQHHNVGTQSSNSLIENSTSHFKRSLSDGNIASDSSIPPSNGACNRTLFGQTEANQGLSDSMPEILTCKSGLSYARKRFGDMENNYFFESDYICYDENGDECSCTSFDKDWLSSSGNSCEDDLYDRYFDRSIAGLSSSENVADLKIEITTSPSESGSSIKGGNRSASMYTTYSDINLDEFSDSFAHWVADGEMLGPLTSKSI